MPKDPKQTITYSIRLEIEAFLYVDGEQFADLISEQVPRLVAQNAIAGIDAIDWPGVTLSVKDIYLDEVTS